MDRDAILTLLVEIEFSEVDVVESGVVVAPLLGIVFAEAIFDFPLQIDLVLLPVPLHLLQILKQLLLPLRYLSLVGERFQTCKYFTNIFDQGVLVCTTNNARHFVQARVVIQEQGGAQGGALVALLAGHGHATACHGHDADADQERGKNV
jgi:hypothetical protein